MLQIAIVEDHAAVQRTLTEYVGRYEKESGEKMKVSLFSDAIDIVSDYTGRYDIIFMDIEMRHLNGMEATKQIRHCDPNVILVFVTNMASYAIQGYAVNAMDYLLKPVPYFAFSQVLQKAVVKVKRNAQSFLMLATEGGVVKLNTSQILYIESVSRRLAVHTKAEEYTLTGTLKEMEQQLRDRHFFRCNNCYLVNLAHVECIRHYDVTVGGVPLQISRPRKKSFMDALADYVGGIAK